MQKRESSAWHVCDSFLLNFHNCNSMVPYQWSMIEEWKKIKSRSRDFQFLFLGAKRPFKSIGLMIVSIKRLMIRSNRHGAPVLPRQRIEGDYHHCNLHLSCLQEPAAHLCSSKMDGNWTFHCWTVFKWLTDVKLLNLLPLSNTYKDPGLLIISAKRLMSRSRRAVPPVKPRHWTVIYICFTSHCFIWSEIIALQHNTTIRRLIQSLLRKYQKIYEWSKRAGAPVKPWQGS